MLPSYTISIKNLPQTTEQTLSPLHPEIQNQPKTPTHNSVPLHSRKESASRRTLQSATSFNLHSTPTPNHSCFPHLQRKQPQHHTKSRLILWTPSLATGQGCPILASRTATSFDQITTTSGFPLLQMDSQRPHPTTHFHSHSHPTPQLTHSQRTTLHASLSMW